MNEDPTVESSTRFRESREDGPAERPSGRPECRVGGGGDAAERPDYRAFDDELARGARDAILAERGGDAVAVAGWREGALAGGGGRRAVDDLLAEVRRELPAAVAAADVGDSGAEWGEFVPLDQVRHPPDPPLDALPDWLREMVASVTEAFQVPAAFPAMYSLALVSGCLAGKYKVEVREGWRVPPVLYVLVGLPPSERKTPVIQELAEPIRTWERERADQISGERSNALLGVEAARARKKGALSQLEKPTGKADLAVLEAAHRQAACALADAEAAVPPEVGILVEYATPEALHVRMAANRDRQVLISDEGAGVFSMTGRYGKPGAWNLDLVLKGFDGAPYTPALKTSAAPPLHAALLSIALGLQPSALLDLIRAAPEIRERGLLARFLVVLPAPRVGSRAVRAPAVPQAVHDNYDLRVRALLDIEDQVVDGRLSARELRLSTAADDAIADFEGNLEPRLGRGGDLERVAAWGGKLAGQVARIAGCLHVADHAGRAVPATIQVKTVGRAVAIVKACIPHALALENLIAAPPEVVAARELLDVLRRHGKPRASAREILKWVEGRTRLGSARDRDSALRVLEEYGYVRPAEVKREEGKAGRPSPEWEIHPGVFRVEGGYL